MTYHCNECEKNLEESNFYKKVKNRCKDCLNKKLKCEVCGKFFSKKWLTNHIEREHQSNVNNDNKIILPENRDNDNNTNVETFQNRANVIIGPRNVGKTYYMLKVLEKIGNKRPIHIITRSPNQYPDYKTSNEIKPINKYKGSVVIFDDMLGAKNSSQIDEFFTRGRHEDLDVYYISQSYFALPRQSIRNNSDRLILFKQTLRDVQSMYHDIGAFDMIYDEFKEMCRVAWSEKFNYLCIDMTKNKNDGKYRIFNESKTTYIDCIPQTEPFLKKQLHLHVFK